MRVLYLDQYFKTPAMAGGTRSYEMARRLVARGHEVVLVTSWTSPDDRRPAFATSEAGIDVRWIPVPYDNSMSFRRRVLAFAEFSVRASGRRLDGTFDVVLATSTPLTIALPGIIASRRHRTPFVFEVRDLWPDLPIAIGALRSPVTRSAARWLERWAYRRSEAVIALSPGMKAGVVRAGIDSDRVTVIPNAADFDLFEVAPEQGAAFRRSRHWLGARPLLVYTGTLGRINGVGSLVDLAVELRHIDPEIRVLIVGHGAEHDRIIRKAASQGVLNVNLFIEPGVAKSEVPSLLSAADMAACLFVDLPEMQANSANKFFDALAASRPILVNYGGWHHRLVREHGIGTSIWRMPAREAGYEVARCLKDRAWCAEAGRAGRDLAQRWFARDLLAERMERVLSAAAQRDHGALAELAGVPAVPDLVDPVSARQKSR